MFLHYIPRSSVSAQFVLSFGICEVQKNCFANSPLLILHLTTIPASTTLLYFFFFFLLKRNLSLGLQALGPV